MKKFVRRIIGLILLLCIFQIIIGLLVKKHTISYKIMVGKNRYTIVEDFEIKNNQHIYTTELKDSKKRKYHFQFFMNVNKKKQVITNIIELNQEDISCIYPILKDGNAAYLSCTDKKQEFSYETLKKTHKEIANEFSKQLKNKKVVLNQKKEIGKTYQNITYYKENLEDRIVTLWNYHELLYLKENKQKIISLFKNDQYKNEYSIVLDDQYIIINTDQEHDFDEIYIIDLKTGTKKSWKLKQKISTDCYFLGTVKDKIYLFDRDHLKEYELDPKKRTIKVVGNTQKNGKYYDGKWHDKNIYDFKSKDLIFPKTISVEKIEEKYKGAKIYESDSSYYFIYKNNLYINYKKFANEFKLLLQDIGMKEVMVIDHEIYFINDDTIYCYDKNNQLKKIVTYRELQFNDHHAYTISKK